MSIYFFVNLLHSPCVWLFDIWHLFDNFTSFWHFDTFFNLNHLSLSQGHFISLSLFLPQMQFYSKIKIPCDFGCLFLPPAYIVWREGTVFTGVCLLTFQGVGGSQVQVGGGPKSRSGGVLVSGLGGPGLRSGGSQSQLRGGPGLRSGGSWSQVWGVLVSGPGGSQSQVWGGVPSLSKGKNFWHLIWLDTCSDWKKFFCRGDPSPPPPPSKGKNFWHQIWLDTCSDWRKIFLLRDIPPVKGKNFDTRFGLIHVQTGGKIFLLRDTPPPSPPSVRGKFFYTRFGLIHVQTGKKNFLSRDPPPPGIARTCYGYAAGGMPPAFTQEDCLVQNRNHLAKKCGAIDIKQ